MANHVPWRAGEGGFLGFLGWRLGEHAGRPTFTDQPFRLPHPSALGRFGWTCCFGMGAWSIACEWNVAISTTAYALLTLKHLDYVQRLAFGHPLAHRTYCLQRQLLSTSWSPPGFYGIGLYRLDTLLFSAYVLN